MAGRIQDEDIALVRERSPIIEVVGEQLQLRTAGGGSFKGLCPFHDEKSPSFHVSPDRGFYYCFGCGEGGDVITFVQKLEHLGFAEAVEKLAARAGMSLRYEHGGASPRQQGARTRLLDAHAAAAEFYAAQLADAPAAEPGRVFLAERGFDLAAAARFGVGFAPRGWDELIRHLVGRGFRPEELVTGGLARAGQRGPIDAFRGRLVWPIRDLSGAVIGFGARRLFDDDPVEAKYLNTPETPLYHKSAVLYGVDLAKREIARRMQAVVVEGYTDVMACHLAGVPTAVATCGTAFGADHAALLRRLLLDQDEFRGEVIFTFDGDEAGRRAALRAFEGDQRFVGQTYVAVEPAGLDPCELRQTHGDAAVRDLVARRQPLVQFAIRSTLDRFDLDTVEGRIAALRATAPLVARIKDRAIRPEYARRLAGWLGMDVEPVLAQVGQHKDAPAGGRHAPERERPALSRPDPRDPRLVVERESIKLAVQRPALVGPLFDALDDAVFTAPAYAAARAAIAAAGGVVGAGGGGPAWISAVRRAAADDELRGLLAELAVEPVRASDGALDRYAVAIVARLREIAATRRITEVKSRLQRLNPVEHAAEYNRLFGELVALEGHKRELREQSIGEL